VIAPDVASGAGSTRPLVSRRTSRWGAVWSLTWRRVALSVLTLFVVSIVVFAATQGLPGNAAYAVLGHSATPESVRALEREMGLDRPVVAQYWS